LSQSIYVSPFQTPDFYRLNNNTPEFGGNVFACSIDGNYKGLVVAVIQKEKGLFSFFSKRAIIYGGPIFSDLDEESVIEFLYFIKDSLIGKAIFIEIRNFFDYGKYKMSFVKAGWSYSANMNVQLLIKGLDKEALQRKFNSTRKIQIRRSLKHGATYEECTSLDDIISIYEILEKFYKYYVKLPIPSMNYFKLLYESPIFKAFKVKHDEKLLGGVFCLILPNKSLYTYYYCGLKDYNKSIYPTHLALLAAMEYALDHQLELVDFMGAGVKDDNYGVRDYKLQFGGDLVEHGRYLKILNSPLYIIGKKGLSLWKLLLTNK
jgi:hypothetical protein